MALQMVTLNLRMRWINILLCAGFPMHSMHDFQPLYMLTENGNFFDVDETSPKPAFDLRSEVRKWKS